MNNNNFLRQIPPVTRHLLLINVLIWIISFTLFQTRGFDLSDYLGLHYYKSPDFNLAQLVTYMFMHDTHGLGHIFFNMFSLYMFGRLLEQVMGSKRFLTYYVICGLGAGIIQLLTMSFQISSLESSMPVAAINEVYANGYDILQEGKNYINPSLGELNIQLNTVIVGASGAIFGILLSFGMIFTNLQLYIMFIPIPIKAKWMVIGYGLLELLFGVSGTLGGVAHFAHLGGMLFGLIVLLIWRKKGLFGGYYN